MFVFVFVLILKEIILSCSVLMWKCIRVVLILRFLVKFFFDFLMVDFVIGFLMFFFWLFFIFKIRYFECLLVNKIVFFLMMDVVILFIFVFDVMFEIDNVFCSVFLYFFIWFVRCFKKGRRVWFWICLDFIIFLI